MTVKTPKAPRLFRFDYTFEGIGDHQVTAGNPGDARSALKKQLQLRRLPKVLKKSRTFIS